MAAKHKHWALLCVGLVFNPPVFAQSSLAVFKDCAQCPEMVVIPAGSFVMGADPDAVDTFLPVPNELPQRRVTIKPFAIGKFEITQAQWFDVMGDRPSEFVGDDLPVETVSGSTFTSLSTISPPRRAKPIGCQPKRNGNMQRARAVQRNILLATMQPN